MWNCYLLFAAWFVQEESEPETGPPDQDAWIQECAISLSPTAELLIIAYEQKAVFLQRKLQGWPIIFHFWL